MILLNLRLPENLPLQAIILITTMGKIYLAIAVEALLSGQVVAHSDVSCSHGWNLHSEYLQALNSASGSSFRKVGFTLLDFDKHLSLWHRKIDREQFIFLAE